jgi:glycosyltransferase involved in cell wall biosynthesis
MKYDLTQEEKPQDKKKIIAAIPCFNEERCIGSVVLKTKKFVSTVIVIDDGSTDATAEIAAEAGAAVYQHGRNLGYGTAVRNALSKGTQLEADVLVILDGDGQHNPEDIPKLIRPLLDGEADIVIGSRLLGGSKRPPFYRRLGQHVLNAATNIGSRQRISDSQSGFRAYSEKALKELNLTENGMSVMSEMQFAISKAGLRVAEVPIDVSYAGKLKRNPIGHGVTVLSRVLVLASLRQPLLLFGTPGLAALAAGLVLGAHVLSVYGKTHELAVGNALATILLCLTGLLALFAALMLQAMKELLREGFVQPPSGLRGYAPGTETATDMHRPPSKTA